VNLLCPPKQGFQHQAAAFSPLVTFLSDRAILTAFLRRFAQLKLPSQLEYRLSPKQAVSHHQPDRLLQDFLLSDQERDFQN
jgi:hypothetical protein